MEVLPVLAVVVPCYNEQEVIPETFRRLQSLLDELVAQRRIAPTSAAWFVDDGSKDRTWALIEEQAETDRSRIRGIKLSRNRGHQVALLAGLLTADGDVLISVDADLQDDLNVIPTMLESFQCGYEIVYGVRGVRRTDSLAKRSSAEAYYRLLQLMGVEIVFNHADYRLMGRRAIEALREFRESNIFLRGLIPQLGYPSTIVMYERAERFAGESKYPLRRMLSLAWDGVTSFSAAPLRLITSLGLVVSLLSLAVGLWALFVRLFTSDSVPGWASIVVPLFLVSGVQLLALGIIGEYIAKIFVETKNRPPYFVEKLVGAQQLSRPRLQDYVHERQA